LAKLNSPPTDTRSWGLSRPAIAALGVGVLVACIGLVAWLTAGGSGAAQKAQRKEIVAYQAKLLPLVQEWGKIEIQGMRPAISDLSRSINGPAPDPNDENDIVVPPEAIGGEAQAWQSGLVDLRKKIKDLPTPQSLTRAKLLFDQAIVRYIDAAKLFEKAAGGPVDQRQAGIDKGIDAATDGARIYNDASVLLQQARRRVGLSASPDFPDHPAGQEKVSG
jgi:hypothetical protein